MAAWESSLKQGIRCFEVTFTLKYLHNQQTLRHVQMTESIPEIPQELKEKLTNGVSQILTPSPSHSSGETSPIQDAGLEEQQEAPTTTSQKKKKKKKSKKSAKAKEAAAKAKADSEKASEECNRPPVLCISRNKHWRYISSYHVCVSYLLYNYWIPIERVGKF